MQNDLILRAPTVNGTWHSFEIGDGPTRLTESTFILLGKENTPVMYCDVYRGDRESGLFEADVVFFDDKSWLVCYDRGFYAINEDYEVRYLYTMSGCQHMGVCGHDLEFPVSFHRKVHHKFCSAGVVFNLWDVQEVTEQGLEVARHKKTVPLSDVHQECCARFHKSVMYFGYEYGGHRIGLYGGRIAYVENGKCYDMTTGGELYGYIPATDR